MATTLKTTVENALLLMPRTYASLLRFKNNWNLDKYLFLSLAQRGDFILDGGANVGLYSQFFSRLVGPKGKVFAFEPTPPTFAQLEKALLDCGAKNVSAHPFALGHENGLATIHLPDGVSGHAALEPHVDAWGDVSLDSFQVEVQRLDDLVEEMPIERLDFIKLDLEGAEPLAIEGASTTLRRHLPSIHLELSPSFMQDFGRSAEDLQNSLEAIGYDALLGFRDKNDSPTLLEDLLRRQPEEIDCTLVCLNRKKHAKQFARLA